MVTLSDIQELADSIFRNTDIKVRVLVQGGRFCFRFSKPGVEDYRINARTSNALELAKAFLIRVKEALLQRPTSEPLPVAPTSNAVNEGYELPRLECLRCGHTWIPRTPQRPKVCPNLKCKSPYWDKPRRQKKAG